MAAYPIERWSIGDVTVTKVVECVQKWPFSALLPDVTPDVLSEHPWVDPYLHEDGRLYISFHVFVVESEGRTIVVDTCIGNDKELDVKVFAHQESAFLDDLAEAGFTPDDVDTVFCTHLHVDHVGWNTRLVDGEWVPTFPRARHLFHRTEYDHWKDEPQDFGDVWGQSIAPVVDAGLVDLVDEDHRITGEVSLELTPGHTPGHCCVRIESGDEKAVITGDMTHHPIQFSRPDMTCSADWKPEMAEATRRDAYRRWSHDTLIMGTHFGTPTAGHLVDHGDAWRLQP